MACTVKQAIAKFATPKRAPSKGKAGKAPLRRNRTGRKLLAMGAKEVKAAKPPVKKAPVKKAPVKKAATKKLRRTPGKESPAQEAARRAAWERGKDTDGGTYPIYKKAGVKAQSFRKAFAAARKAGKKTFYWGSRKYTTKRA